MGIWDPGAAGISGFKDTGFSGAALGQRSAIAISSSTLASSQAHTATSAYLLAAQHARTAPPSQPPMASASWHTGCSPLQVQSRISNSGASQRSRRRRRASAGVRQAPHGLKGSLSSFTRGTAQVCDRRRPTSQQCEPQRRACVVVAAVELASSARGQEQVSSNECEQRAWEVVRELEDLCGGDGESEKAHQRSLLQQLTRWGQQLRAEGQTGSSRELRVRGNRLMGCTAQVWAEVVVCEPGAGPNAEVELRIDSDAAVTLGLCAVLQRLVGRAPADQVLSLSSESPALLTIARLLGPAVAGPARANGLVSMLLSVQKRLRRQLATPGTPAALQALESLPSILISSNGEISAQGEFALSQSQYLNPDPASVDGLVEVLSQKKIGVVAHFYMDPQVQGVLVAAQERWPHIAISDSLVMADRALKMVAEGGCEAITVLGVDFMAENVRAVLEKGGMGHVPVLRMSEQQIGCSLADAARSEAYLRYLEEASRTPKSIHVIYINTALDTKAVAHHLLPTITCTSSNVLQTVLQAFAQVPEATVWFGPDTYMGGNLVEMLSRLAMLPDEDIRALHPQHTAASLQALVPRVRFFQDGACIVHDMFGSEVVQQLRTAYADAYHTAHFEVPGEMFALAMEARARGRGTVGSTQNILDFIVARTREALARGFDERLQFVLGTESGMVTAIVNAVRTELAKASSVTNGAPRPNVEVEIVFPVNSAAITDTQAGTDAGASSAAASDGAGVVGALSGALRVVPGAATGEGCSFEGGCASCPYMKRDVSRQASAILCTVAGPSVQMNSLEALMHVCHMVGSAAASASLAAHEPDKFKGQQLPLASGSELTGSATVADLGYQPILHMRHFQKNGSFSQDLVQDMQTRNNS